MHVAISDEGLTLSPMLASPRTLFLGLALLLEGFEAELSFASDLKPCFDLEELRLRNYSLKNGP
jgi:hypothetical protein